jgi:hypothetical protein
VTGKQLGLGISILILAAANIVYWWPSHNSQENMNYKVSALSNKTVNLDDLHGLEFLPLADNQVIRDLFMPVVQKKAINEEQIETIPVTAKVDDPAPVRKNNILSTDHLTRYRLLGIMVKKGEPVAYLIDGKTPIVAHAGDNLAQKVVVEKIGEQAAILKDLQTGLTRKLMLAGE